MTRMHSASGHRQKKVVEDRNTNGRAASEICTTNDDILRRLFPPGATIDLEFSIAASYHGPPVEFPVPRAPLAFLADGNKKNSAAAKHFNSYLPVAQPLKISVPFPQHQCAPSTSASSPPKQQLEEAAASPSINATSEIEEVITSPSQFFGRTPSSEGIVTDSSILQYSEDLSAPDSGRMNNGDSSGWYDPSPSGKMENSSRKSGQCYNCLKGSRYFTEKESCMACGSKYCVNCVLLVMGSMPEGRKCVECIGRPILEARRVSLGKPSRLLKKLLSPLEVEQCMKSERECSANQLQPEQVIVNGRPLTAEEMAKLLGYVSLKPGAYWYDNSSGLWGKEGEKPTLVVAPELNVGGPLRQNASDGSTQVFLNNREVTKSELKMLRTLGVQCTPPTYLVLYADGRYGDEGQKEAKGNLWNKPTMRLLHMFFSFPTPRSRNPQIPVFSRKVSPASLEVKDASKILLLGHEGSGRSTIFKQTKILHDRQFWPQEVDKYKKMILGKCFQFLSILLEARERFEEENSSGDTITKCNIYSLDEQLKDAVEKFLDDMANGLPEKTSHLNLSKIWNDSAIRETYKRRDELYMLPEVSGDLLSRVLQTNDYVPLQSDILLAEGLEQGTGLAEVEFTLEDKDLLSDSNGAESSTRRFQLISIGGLATSEFRKWLGMFEDVKVLVYCVAVSDYDQWYTDSTGALHNKLVFSRDLFVKIVGYPCFQDTPLVLLLNKYDKFEEKVTKGIQLTNCEWFSDYSPVGSSNSSQVQQAYMYVVHKYKRLLEGRRVYTLQLNAQEQQAVSGALEYVQQILKCEDEKKIGLWMLQEESIYGDTSSFSVQAGLLGMGLGTNR